VTVRQEVFITEDKAIADQLIPEGALGPERGLRLIISCCKKRRGEGNESVASINGKEDPRD